MADLPAGTVTFLFTDIEGSTQLLRLLGSRYGEVLGEHQRIIRGAIAAHGGREVDTQGDSFFVAFGRAKDAVAAAVDAQRDLAAHSWPEGVTVRVRMGLHTGEPRLGGDRYVGLGVHKAARIGAAGHGGQVLLSRTTRDLVEDELPPGVSLQDLGERRLKDLERTERLSQLVIQGLPSRFGRLKTLDEELRRRRRLLYAGSALIGVVAAAIAVPVFALGQRDAGGGAKVKANSLAVVDPRSNSVSASVSVGVRPAGIAFGAGSIWVANEDDRTLSRVDPATLALQRTIPLEGTPTGIAFGGGAVWVANGPSGTVSRVDPGTDQVVHTTDVTTQTSVGSVAIGAGVLWAAFADSTLVKIDLSTGRVRDRGGAGVNPAAIAVGAGAVWVANAGDSTVSRILPLTLSAIGTLTVGRHPSGLAVGDGAVWVADQGDGTVTRIDVGSGSETTIPVGNGPSGIAVGTDGIWVANADDGTLSRIDPAERRVVATLSVGGRPTGVLVAGGRVLVSVQATT